VTGSWSESRKTRKVKKSNKVVVSRLFQKFFFSFDSIFKMLFLVKISLSNDIPFKNYGKKSNFSKKSWWLVRGPENRKINFPATPQVTYHSFRLMMLIKNIIFRGSIFIGYPIPERKYRVRIGYRIFPDSISGNRVRIRIPRVEKPIKVLWIRSYANVKQK
jgi:hypothetical protein